MRTFRRKLVMTPMLMAMALMALGIPATAQAVYQQSSSQACCSDQACCAEQPSGASCEAGEQACCPAEQPGAAPAACCEAAGDVSPACDSERPVETAQRSCVPAQSCCPGARSALGCCP